MPIVVAPPSYVDASYFQAVIDVAAYKAAGFTRIAHRATFRDAGVDSAFVGRWPTFAGLTRQAYHFAYEGDIPDRASQHFLDVVASAGGFHDGDEAMLDCEWFQLASGEWVGLNPVHGKEYAAIWNAAVATQAPNVRRFFYGNAWWFEQAGITAADFPNVGMITAAYGASYRTPNGWPHSCIWQYTDRETVPGFPGELVDYNRVTCPTGLDHLTYDGGDELNDADKQWITDLINGQTGLIGARFDEVVGTRTQPPDKAGAKTTLCALADGQYLAYHGDATHPGLLPLLQDIKTAVASGTVDPQLPAKIDALIAELNGLTGGTWTVTKAAS